MLEHLRKMGLRTVTSSPTPSSAAKTTPRTEPRSLSRNQGIWLLGAAALTLAPHAEWLPIWIFSLCAALLGWRAVLLWRGSAPPPHLLLLALAAAVAIGVRFEFDYFFGKDPGVALLALLLGLKLLETRRARDIRAAVLLCFFLQLAIFFENQSLPIAALALVATLSSLGALLALHDVHAHQRQHLRTAATLLVQGMPFMLLLFLLFPRIDGPLWGLPADAFSARTGLSDNMSPGSISALSNSGEIAFRAAFEGAPPPPSQRYWRGPVLTDFDGRNWSARRFAEANAPFYTPAGTRLDYALTLEAHNRRWLLALDFPGEAQPGIRYASDFHALATRPVQTRTRFSLSAYPDTPVGAGEAPELLAAALQLPPQSNPRSRALATELAAGARNHAEILERVIAHLRRSPLVYTLRPPLLGTHTADEFLFDTQRGFCEHFASAFVVVMRAAGVPTRVVTGYQGGELNPVDGQLVVRQSDAHAWAEVWLADRGWLRVDPTALAAPRRIEEGLAAALPSGEAVPLMLQQRMQWLRGLRHQWEALSNAWNQRVLGYNPQRQRELLERLGLQDIDAGKLVAALSVAGLLIFACLYAWATRLRRSADPVERLWQAFCAKLAKRGLPRHPWEGPKDYSERLARALPDQADALRAIADCYAHLRYAPHPGAPEKRLLRHTIKALKLP